MTEKIQSLKKVLALAEAGIDGEREAAQRLLHKLLTKYDLTLDDLEEEKPIRFEFPYIQRKYEFLFCQIARMVVGAEAKLMKYRRTPSTHLVDCSMTQRIDILRFYDFYVKLYEREFAQFNEAFIHANKLFPKDAKTRNLYDLTEEEQQEAREMLKKAEAIKKATPHHQLETQVRRTKFNTNG